MSIREEEFHFHGAFLFLHIETEHGHYNGDQKVVGRKDFTSIYNPNAEDYQKLLRKTTGDTFFRDKRAKFRLSSLKGHTHITGETGSGKSQFMRLLFWHVHKKILKQQNVSAVLIDVHGDLAKEIKASSLNRGNDRLIYISSTLKTGFSPIINPLQVSNAKLIDKTTEFIAEAFDELLNNQLLSDQMRTLLIPCLRVLIKAGDKNLRDLQKFMMDDPELMKLGIVSDIPSHREFFKNKFRDKNYSKTKNAIYTRIQNLMNSPQFSNMTLGNNTINLSKEMNGGKIILFDLSGLGSITKEAMGRLLIAQIKAIAENRESIKSENRPTTYLFLDEAQNFLTKSIEKTLNEMRKFKLFLILAHQYVKQLGDLFYPVMSNTQTKIVFYNDDSNLSKLAGYMGLKKDEMKKKWKMYECWVKTGREEAVKIKPSNKLIRKKKHQLSSKEEKILEKRIIATYYKKLDDHTTPEIHPTQVIEFRKPLYELYLGKT